jgi:hypothetical protein
MKGLSQLCLALLLAICACSEEPERLSGPDDYIIFGDFYGECIGQSCIDIFKIADQRVFEDTLDVYPSVSSLPHTVSFVASGSDRFDALNELIGQIPADLFDESTIVIGEPDAGDWGGFYLETNTSGDVRYWLIDKMEDNLPGYLSKYADKLEAAVQIAGS